jgi:hypothetical protein
MADQRKEPGIQLGPDELKRIKQETGKHAQNKADSQAYRDTQYSIWPNISISILGIRK